MKKFNKIETTKAQDRIISNLFTFLYPDHTFYFAGNGLLCIHKKTDNSVKFLPQCTIHWYELMRNNIIPDLREKIKKSGRILYFLYDEEKIKEELYNDCYKYEHILEEFLEQEVNYEWNDIFEKLDEVLTEIKKYEQIISDRRTNGQSDNNGKGTIPSIHN